ncbi:hypothetical protein LO762_04610 [Actinocorallia sp. API 0066]|uniref:hypothetical protein n=1 Tax=Actinocorallia sp. API 0066 TaxID=2896846 RepID=UPI001E541DFC|nr:hypothetical protein [Actinocorallia sp. API 0066]MCD0448479.1 hypothetical protein [Actinocorallia sp. API 0066]
MRTILAAVVALTVPLAVVPATAASATPERKPACSLAKQPKFQKIIDVKPGGVGKARKKHPYGSLTGRYTKLTKGEFGDGYYKPVGKKKTRGFAKKAVICLIVPTDSGLAMRKVGLKSLRKAVDRPVMNPQWGLQWNTKGRITLAYQIYAP